MSPCTNSMRPASTRSRMFARLPAYDNASRTTTLRVGSALMARAKLLPMKPAPPVMSQVATSASPVLERRRASFDSRRSTQREIVQALELAPAQGHGVEHESGDDAHERKDH